MEQNNVIEKWTEKHSTIPAEFPSSQDLFNGVK